jgi:hypothetical protein
MQNLGGDGAPAAILAEALESLWSDVTTVGVFLDTRGKAGLIQKRKAAFRAFVDCIGTARRKQTGVNLCDFIVCEAFGTDWAIRGEMLIFAAIGMRLNAALVESM